mmetsp:Transcript_7697/g.11198  ORF Transcript_7697/g.11198 Transcript_7697/m.11198 type:complete len:200 (-) Transcript_7697:214-813(-)
MAVSIKFVHPLIMPAILEISSPTKSFCIDRIIGMPPQTAASYRNSTALAELLLTVCRRFSMSGKYAAISALFAVTTFLPFWIALYKISFASPVPPITSTIRSIESSSKIALYLVVSAQPDGIFQSRVLDASCTQTLVTSSVFPVSALKYSFLSFKISTTPPPTTPPPKMPILTVSSVACSVVEDSSIPFQDAGTILLES